MKNYFIGFQHLNISIAFVNRQLLRYLPADKYKTHCQSQGKKRFLDSCLKILTSSRKVVVSGIFLGVHEIRLMKLMRKKIIYLMHGSYMLETGKYNRKEDLVLRNCDTIVSVSRFHADLICRKFPEHAHKVVEWFNGVDWDEAERQKALYKDLVRDPDKIILFGGGRGMKNNLEVCKAVAELNDQYNLNLQVDVYGDLIEEDASRAIASIDCVRYKEPVPHAEIFKELSQSALFIANSSYDTFNLSVIEALSMGASVLFSQFVGVKDIIKAKTDRDVIYNPLDIAELKEKILYALNNPNRDRLYDSIDKEETSWQNRARQFEKIVEEV